MFKEKGEQFSKWISQFTNARVKLLLLLFRVPLPIYSFILYSVFEVRQLVHLGFGRKIAAWCRSVTVLGPVFVTVCLILCATKAEAANSESELVSAANLSQMTLDELSNIEISSVSKKPELLGNAPAAIYVITQEDIRRSGATGIPEILRLAPNLQVARVDASQYAITARGFNSTTANKLLVLIDGRSVYTPPYSGVFWDAQDILLKNNDRIRGLRKFPQILRRG